MQKKMSKGEDHSPAESLPLKPAIASESKKTVHSTYLQRLVFLSRLIPSFSDHVTDVLLLSRLLAEGWTGLFSLGLVIDLILGPITVLQARIRGYSLRKSLSLVFHPVNGN